MIRVTTDVQVDLSGEMHHCLASAKQGDKATRFIRFRIMDGDTEFEIPDGAIAIANIQKPDGKFCYNKCDIVENRIILELTNQTLAAAGTAYCDIEIRSINNEFVLSSATFTIEIEKNMRNEGAIESGNELTGIEKRVEICISKTKEAEQKALEAARKIEQEGADSLEALGGLSKSGGTMTGDINMGGHSLDGLPKPDRNDQAATKAYADDREKNAKDYTDSRYKCFTVTLAAGEWQNKTQTVAAAGVTADNDVIVAPAPANFVAYAESVVYCTAQGAGTLTFACDSVPAEDLAVNVMIHN